MRDGEDGGVLNDNDGGSVGRSGSGQKREVKEVNEIKEVTDPESLRSYEEFG